jgi:hyperosmotically inducible periplasmic protein
MGSAIAGLVFGALLASGIAFASDSDADRSDPTAFVRDSAITAKVKAGLALQHLTSLGRIQVDTDMNGAVWLTGSARTQEAATQAVAIARDTEGVTSVHSEIEIQPDD